jgi:predicted molibdopterin-dependent oxidoreductase YjgC
MRQSVSAQTANPTITLTIDGNAVSVAEGTSVAAALLQAGVAAHKSVFGEPRNSLCAMGVCMECCATVDGIQHVRTCQTVVRPGMNVVTG